MLKRASYLSIAFSLAGSLFLSAPRAEATDFIIEPETIVIALTEEIPNIVEGSECADPDYWAGDGVSRGGDWQNGRSAGTYDSHEDAIQDAVDGASAGDTIYLCAGTWDFQGVVEVDKDLSVVGAGQNSTILDGGGANQIFTTWIARGDPPVYSGYSLDLADMTLQYASSWNGAAYLHGDSTILRCTFKNNESFNIGGALEANATLLVEDSLFLDNQSRWTGGAIFASILEVRNTQFIGNSNVYVHDGNDDASGGAISFSNSLIVDDSEFRDNSAEENADGVGTDWGYGGAIFGLSGFLTIRNTKFIGNSSGSGGAVYVMWDGEQEIVRNSFIGNIAANPEGQGGAIRLSAVTNQTVITKNTFDRNEAWQGGAVSLNDTGEPTDQSWNAIVRQNRFARNQAIGSGGALHFALDDSGRVTPRNFGRNRFSRNRADNGGAMVVESDYGRARQIVRRFTRVVRQNRFLGNRAFVVRGSRNLGVHFD